MRYAAPVLCDFNEALKLLRKKYNIFKETGLKFVEVDKIKWRKQVSQQQPQKKKLKIYFPTDFLICKT